MLISRGYYLEAEMHQTVLRNWAESFKNQTEFTCTLEKWLVAYDLITELELNMRNMSEHEVLQHFLFSSIQATRKPYLCYEQVPVIDMVYYHCMQMKIHNIEHWNMFQWMKCVLGRWGVLEISPSIILRKRFQITKHSLQLISEDLWNWI